MLPLLLAVCVSVVGVRGLAAYEPEIWLYFIPITFALFLTGLHILDIRNRAIVNRILRDSAELLSSDEREMLILNPSLFVPRLAAADYVLLPQKGVALGLDGMRVVAVVYGIVCIALEAWEPAALSLALLLYTLLSPLANAFDAWNRLDSEERAVHRYLSHLRRQHGLQEEDVFQAELAARAHYANVDRKVHTLALESGCSR